MNVQFDTEDIDGTARDFAVLGITAEFVRVPSRKGGIVVANFAERRAAQKLHDYLESHHCSGTVRGKIKTLPVDGWDILVEAAGLIH